MKSQQKIAQWWRDIQPFLKRAKEVLVNRSGEGDMTLLVDACEKLGEKITVERDMIVGGVTVRIESIFSRQTTLDKAIKNIILRKSTEG